MEEIIISFDISEKRLDFEDADALIGEISDRLGKVLREASSGRWS